MNPALEDSRPPRTLVTSALGALLFLAGMLGIAVGTVPALHHFVVGLIGRSSNQASADFPWFSLIAVIAIYSLLFIVFRRRLAHAAAPTVAGRRASVIWVAGLVLILTACWFPFRQNKFAVFYEDRVSVWTETGTIATYEGDDVDAVRRQYAGVDETRDAMAIEILGRDGFSAFWEAGKSNWLLQHPPVGYVLASPLHSLPWLLRGLCLLVFCASLAAIARWAFAIGGDGLMVLSTLVLVSASGLIQDLTHRLSLDVLVMLPGVAFGWLLFGSSGRPGKAPGVGRWLTSLGLMTTMILTKFIAILIVPGSALALWPRQRMRAVVLAATGAIVFVGYHAILVGSGVPFEATYLGDLLAKFGGEPRSFQHGGHKRSLTTLVVFILSPLGLLVWGAGIAAAAVAAFRSTGGRAPDRDQLNHAAPWRHIVTVACVLLLIVYVLHPLLRYTSAGLWAIVLSAAFGLAQLRSTTGLVDPAVASAGAYSLTKLLQEAYF